MPLKAGISIIAAISFGSGIDYAIHVIAAMRPSPGSAQQATQYALRHTGNNGQIRLQARRHGERVIVSVEDNGEGIAYGQQGRIFEPFVQVGRKKGGAGLGLALCKEIVQLHGGRMGVYSRPGQGSQFYMALPLYRPLRPRHRYVAAPGDVLELPARSTAWHSTHGRIANPGRN